MWALQNNTPYPAERSWVRDTNGAEIWIVAVKGTFTIKPDGTTELAEKQEAVLAAPVYHGEPGQSSLLYEADLVRTKNATDILLHGHAYPQPGKAVVDVIMKVADIEKRLRVIGERYLVKGFWGMNVTDPKPLESIPIIYEHAFGGQDKMSSNPEEHAFDQRNPLGRGFAVKAEHLVGERLPNIQSPEHPITKWQDSQTPAGFGPIPAHWQPRLKYAGTYDKTWEKERMPLVPHDFDKKYFQCAPADQQSNGFLTGGEAVELRNLTPDGLLKFTLPHITLQFQTIFTIGEPADHPANLHTVILEPDNMRVIMVWHTALACHGRLPYLEKTIIQQENTEITVN